MIGDLKQYAEYKDSGLPWLGQVPEHWSVQRTKWQFGHRKELNADGNHTNVLSLTLRGVVNNNPDDPEGLVPKDYRTYQFFAKGDLVFKLIDLENLRTSRVGLVHEDGIMSSAYVRLVPTSSTNMRYFFHQFYDLYARGIYNQLGAGVRSTLSSSDLLNVGIAIPPPGEQAAIVRFLDWANGRLERAVKAKRKVAALLNEQKQAIIHRAVTRGLDPSVPLRPSGIPWLGDIPEHWEVRRLGSLLRERGEVNSNGEVSSVLSLLRSRGVIPYDEKGNVGNKKSDDITRYKIVRPDDIVMNCMNVIIGSVGISRYTGCLSPVYYVLVRRNETDSAHYLNAVFQCSTFYRSLVRIGNGILAHRMRIPMELLKCELLPYPPQTEQVQIVEMLGTATEALDKAINRTEREIQYLREYRIRLVADVITGKVDVREAAARFPEEVPLGTVEDAADLGEDLDIADEEATA
jgi:type I restriction enzyme S subunit